ncbi:acetyl-CoA acyltransferase [Micromonospora rhizosphaerae]|uniref:Probable acetyl-CoA acetyltransferase n=1 Tax=Micromonospora rhizosphaerae TaxID=568872 RepID=A0A1C6T3Z7_9ACTN|nr:thiolase family protein [Micromonospora rhizosphaerae]SCL36508.1 acetyl-CoA acyltransferase [Micromonospora rhizosphaerae]
MNELRSPVILDAVRTPFGRYRGGLSGIRVDDLAALPIAELVARHPGLDPEHIDDVVYGNTNGAGEENRNVARMAGLLAGLPVTVPGTTVNRLCASGGEALLHGARTVAVGEANLVIAGGVEGMSRAPFVLPKPEDALPRSMELHQTTVGWRMVNPRLPAHWTGSLGGCAERVAAELGIGRDEQDAWALRSHERASAAWETGLHDDYVMAVTAPDGTVVRRDESVRPNTNAAKLAALRPAFASDGTVTAGNSSPINDGALALLVGTRGAAEELGLTPLGRILGSATVAVEPDRFSIAPVPAVERALARAGLGHRDVDVWEINEAFAAMVLSTLRGLPEIDLERVNPNGGAIAIGHPLGASLLRVVADLCRQLRRRGGGVGVACACIGVGQGQAIVVEVQ